MTTSRTSSQSYEGSRPSYPSSSSFRPRGPGGPGGGGQSRGPGGSGGGGYSRGPGGPGGGGQSRGPGGGGGGQFRGGRRGFRRGRRVCNFCVDHVDSVDYKAANRLRRYVSDRARIDSSKKTGTCAKHQRMVRRAIVKARFMALLPFSPDHTRVTNMLAPRTPGEAAASEAGAVVQATEVEGGGGTRGWNPPRLPNRLPQNRLNRRRHLHPRRRLQRLKWRKPRRWNPPPRLPNRLPQNRLNRKRHLHPRRRLPT